MPAKALPANGIHISDEELIVEGPDALIRQRRAVANFPPLLAGMMEKYLGSLENSEDLTIPSEEPAPSPDEEETHDYEMIPAPGPAPRM